jgi:hypothetical protein
MGFSKGGLGAFQIAPAVDACALVGDRRVANELGDRAGARGGRCGG